MGVRPVLVARVSTKENSFHSNNKLSMTIESQSKALDLNRI